MRRFLLVLTLAAVLASVAQAEEQTPLLRDEVAVLKKKLVAVSAALGQPPSGYSKDNEDFSLPTESYKQKSGKFNWVTPSMNAKFSGGGEKKAKKSQKQLEQDYQKKMSEAMAKGDYEAMSKYAQEMQQEHGKAQVAEIEGKRVPIEVRINLNSWQNQVIDPDGVVFEKAGVIALLVDTKDENRNRLVIYFDPVALKQTKTLSKVELKQPEGGVSKANGVYNAVVQLEGPGAEIKAWAQRIDTGTVLGQIDGR